MRIPHTPVNGACWPAAHHGPAAFVVLHLLSALYLLPGAARTTDATASRISVLCDHS